MPIDFTVYKSQSYYIAKFSGIITNEVMLEAYSNFFSSDDWHPGLNELTDISEADLAAVTASGVEELSDLIESIISKHSFTPKVAVFAPNDLAYGLARASSAYTEPVENHEVFRDLNDAKNWLFADYKQSEA